MTDRDELDEKTRAMLRRADEVMHRPEKSHLAQLIERAVTNATYTRIARSTETVAEELASDLLRDPEFRERMRALVRAAFEKALADLTAPPDKPGARE